MLSEAKSWGYLMIEGFADSWQSSLAAARVSYVLSSMARHQTRVLVVDDTKLDRELLHAHLTRAGYAVEVAEDGEDAWNLLQREPRRFDLVLLDRSMPRMGGLELLQHIKEHDRMQALPVIMQTASAGHDEMVEGLAAGAYYYLTKPYDAQTLLAVVSTAARDYASYRELQQVVSRGAKTLALMQEATFHIRTMEEAKDLGTLLAAICPDPMNAVIGLTELLVNAVEHGNLGITYEEKSNLNATGAWETEVEHRLGMPENAAKLVTVSLARRAAELRFTIRDEGPGFEWLNFVQADPGRAFDNHGRGIVIARSVSFDEIEYHGAGNEVTAVINLS